MKTSLFRSLALLTMLSACFGESPVPTGPTSALARFGKTAGLVTTLGPGGYVAANGGIITTVFLGGDGQYRTEIWDTPGNNFVGVTHLTSFGTRETMQRLAAGEEIKFKFLQRELVTVPEGTYDGPGATLWSGDPSRNSDNRPHTSVWEASDGCYIVGFEETLGGGDEDYNDATFEVCLGSPDNDAPVANPGPVQTVECASARSAPVTLDGSGSSDPNGDPLTYTWRDRQGNVIGTSAIITVTCTGFGSHGYHLTVDDGRGASASAWTDVWLTDTTPPVIEQMTVSMPVLDPPNHKMSYVYISYSATDACSPGFVSCQIESVTANEPVAADDIEIVSRLSLNLRADRNGNGTGRIYTITMLCNDGSNNTVVKTLTVTVPKGKK